jgi:methylated-DNA-[protein]-cysteine S-methyltransferase
MIASFKDKVYEFTRQIPKGKVATYGQLAKLAGKPKAGRAVGAFMRVNPDAPRTPCHRVVASDGSLTGYSGIGGISKKKAMLIAEGVKFKGEKIDLNVSQCEIKI